MGKLKNHGCFGKEWKCTYIRHHLEQDWRGAEDVRYLEIAGNGIFFEVRDASLVIRQRLEDIFEGVKLERSEALLFESNCLRVLRQSVAAARKTGIPSTLRYSPGPAAALLWSDESAAHLTLPAPSFRYVFVQLLASYDE